MNGNWILVNDEFTFESIQLSSLCDCGTVFNLFSFSSPILYLFPEEQLAVCLFFCCSCCFSRWWTIMGNQNCFPPFIQLVCHVRILYALSITGISYIFMPNVVGQTAWPLPRALPRTHTFSECLGLFLYRPLLESKLNFSTVFYLTVSSCMYSCVFVGSTAKFSCDCLFLL